MFTDLKSGKRRRTAELDLKYFSIISSVVGL